MTTAEEHLFLRSDIEYSTNLSEIEFLNRYYLYAEYIVSPRSDVTTWNVTLTFGDNGTADNASYLNTVVKIDGTVSTKQITVTGIYNGTTIGTITVTFGEGASSIPISQNYIVLSVMILPKLNQNNKVDQSIDDTNDIANIIIFIDGVQMSFNNNAVLPLVKFYSTDTDENKEEFVATNKIKFSASSINYAICNTEFDKFVYQSLALQCYNEYSANRINIQNPKIDLVPIRNIEAYIPLNGINTAFNTNAPYSIYNNTTEFIFSQDSETIDNNTILFYAEIYISKAILESLSHNANDYIFCGLVINNNFHYNWFDNEYKHLCSNLPDSKWEENESTKYMSSIGGMYIGPVSSDDIRIINEDYSSDYTYIFEDETNNAICIVYYLIKENGVYNIYGAVKEISYDETNPNNNTSTTFNISQNRIRLTQLQNLPVSTQPLSFSIDTLKATSYVFYLINCGEKPYMLIPSDHSDDEFFIRSKYSSNWKSMYQYNRDIDFSSDLQDNPIILPLNVIKDSTDNMFVEMILNNAGTLNDGVCFGIIDYPVFNGVSDINPGVAQYGNGFTLAIYPSTTYNGQYKTVYQVYKDGSEIYKYEEDNNSLPISIMYYKNNSTGKIVCRKNVGEEDINIAQVDSTTMKNIYIHGNGTCNCTLNFGPTSDTFQDYIDELLEEDNPKTIRILNTNIISGKQFYNVKDLTSGGGVQPQPEIIDTVSIDDQTQLGHKFEYDDESYQTMNGLFKNVLPDEDPNGSGRVNVWEGEL